tara:strand:+ start:951 stop:1211 length:261 start_codon:yes stop_codon:yes gene_type:complete
MDYIRFTLSALDEATIDTLALAVEHFAGDNMLAEGDDGMDATIYETEFGHSIEFALTGELSESIVEAICDSLGAYIEDFTVEVTGQ